jgi:hypothetical protein
MYGKDNKVRRYSRGLKTSGPIILLRTSNRFDFHEAPRPNEPVKLKKNPQYMLFRLYWSRFGGVICATLPHMTSCLFCMLEGFPVYAYMIVGFYQSLVFYSLVSMALENLLSTLQPRT